MKFTTSGISRPEFTLNWDREKKCLNDWDQEKFERECEAAGVNWRQICFTIKQTSSPVRKYVLRPVTTTEKAGSTILRFNRNDDCKNVIEAEFHKKNNKRNHEHSETVNKKQKLIDTIPELREVISFDEIWQMTDSAPKLFVLDLDETLVKNPISLSLNKFKENWQLAEPGLIDGFLQFSEKQPENEFILITNSPETAMHLKLNAIGFPVDKLSGLYPKSEDQEQDKSQRLKTHLKKCESANYTQVVIIDDEKTNLYSMIAACNELEISSIGIHYLGLIPNKHQLVIKDLIENESVKSITESYSMEDVYAENEYWKKEWDAYQRCLEVSVKKQTQSKE